MASLKPLLPVKLTGSGGTCIYMASASRDGSLQDARRAMVPPSRSAWDLWRKVEGTMHRLTSSRSIALATLRTNATHTPKLINEHATKVLHSAAPEQYGQ
eukprot:1557448-Amphidinium_carterae.2